MSQADYFLKSPACRKATFRRCSTWSCPTGGLRRWGGRDVLFREMLVWLKGRSPGDTTPIIYVSQDFVNRYMPFAPEELAITMVACYGEYKAIRAFALTGSSRPTAGSAVSKVMWTSTYSMVRRNSSRGICGRKP